MLYPLEIRSKEAQRPANVPTANTTEKDEPTKPSRPEQKSKVGARQNIRKM